MKLSKSKIESFYSDVLPLYIIADRDISSEDIKWYSENENVKIRGFSDAEQMPFNDGVLITLMGVGTSKVFAEIGDEKLCCEVLVRERRRFKKGEKLEFFAGDLHAHSCNNHDYKTFPYRESGYPIDCYNTVKEDGRLDFFVMSDHAGLLFQKDFYRGFTDLEKVEPLDTVIFPGCESQCSPALKEDRFGLVPKKGGEIVSFNTDNFINTNDWKAFEAAFADSPLPILSFAHPQLVSWFRRGNCDFNFHEINTPELIQLMKLIEMGNGGDRETNAIDEYSYSVALDCGFRVSPCSTSDAHGPRWGYSALPGKTIIMAPDKSKEMLLDALYENRVYACETGQVKLTYNVNGFIAGETVSETDTYKFHVETDLFSDDEECRPVKLSVISDGGKTIKYIEGNMSSLDFEIKSDSAAYFYLRFTDIKGRRTWSAPVWTGRPCRYKVAPVLSPIDKSEFKALDLSTGKDAGKLVNDNPEDFWISDTPTPTILIDMGEEYEIEALGHYPLRPIMGEIINSGKYPNDIVTQYVNSYRVLTSTDGVEFDTVAEGILRVFGKEEFITFKPTKARFVKFEVVSSTGRALGLPKYENATVRIGELTVFRR